MSKPMFDVAAISIKESTVIWVDGPKTARNAEAVIRMAIMRQGVEDRFFAACQPGQYKDGDKWEGGVDIPSADVPEGYSVTDGGMMYPLGKRGL